MSLNLRHPLACSGGLATSNFPQAERAGAGGAVIENP
jgi:hypothetical protein